MIGLILDVVKWRLMGLFTKLTSIDAATGVRISRVASLEKLGSGYGGWIVPVDMFGARSVCYCVGAGLDISFDLALARRLECEVCTLDPTPRSAAYVTEQAKDEPNLHFFPVGLWCKDEVMRFYAPENAAHVSHSILNIQKTRDYFEAQCRRLSSFMAEHGHERLDLLKLDIEGAEYDVVDSIIEDRLDIRVICVEYDEAFKSIDSGYMGRIRESVAKLRAHGYVMVASEPRCNYTFIRSDLL